MEVRKMEYKPVSRRDSTLIARPEALDSDRPEDVDEGPHLVQQDDTVPPQVLGDLAQALSMALGSAFSSHERPKDLHAAGGLLLATEEYDGEPLHTRQRLPSGLLGSQADLVSFLHDSNLDPMSQAILGNRPEQVRHWARCRSDLLEAAPAFERATHLHLAASASQCFEELLSGICDAVQDGDKVAAKHLEQALHFHRPSGMTLAEHIVSCCCAGSSTPPDDNLEAQCWHARMLAKILDLGSTIRPAAVVLSNRPCVACVGTYFQELAQRRQRLKQLARQHLPRQQIRDFGLNDDKVLDLHLAAVLRMLRRRRVSIPRVLITTDESEDPQPLWLTQRLTAQLDESAADILIQSGFVDIGATRLDGSTPLDDVISFFATPQLIPRTYLLLSWILQKHDSDEPAALERQWQHHNTSRHGYSVPSPVEMFATSAGVTTRGHVVAVGLGHHLASSHSQHGDGLEPWQALFSRIMPLTTVDQSLCLCSGEGGRCPFSMLLLSVLRTLGVHYEDHTTEFLAGALDLVLETCDSPWEPWHFRAAFRLVTFEALSLGHTCNGVVNREPTDGITESVNNTQAGIVFREIVEWSNDMISDYFSQRPDGTNHTFPTTGQINDTETSQVEPLQHSETSDTDVHGSQPGSSQVDCHPSSMTGAVAVPDEVRKNWLKEWTQRMDVEHNT